MSDWNDFLAAFRDEAPPKPTEHRLWTLQKAGRTAASVVRPHPLGSEPRLLVNNELVWSEVFRDGRGAALGELAEQKRAEFEARGWT